MNVEDFLIMMGKKEGDYGLLPPPISEEEALDILISHFLEEDYYTVNPISKEQFNTEAVYDILCRVSESDLKILKILHKII